MNAVIAGEDETAIPPIDLASLATPEQLEHLRAIPKATKICKIDQARSHQQRHTKLFGGEDVVKGPLSSH